MSRLLNIREAAQYIGVSERTLYSYTTQYGGSIPIVKLSPRNNKIDVADLDRFIEIKKRGVR
jgi:predicted site-specific integrase-resolvase